MQLAGLFFAFERYLTFGADSNTTVTQNDSKILFQILCTLLPQVVKPALNVASTFSRHGVCSLRWQQLRSVTVSGDVRVKDDGCWRKTKTHTLTVNKEDAELALTVVQKQLSLLTVDLRLNVVRVDPKGAAGSLDLVGYFVRDAYDCAGRVWVELKLWGKATFNESFQAEQTALAERFPKEQRKDKSLTGVLLVAGKVERAGREWEKPVFVACLWTPEKQWSPLYVLETA